MKTRPISLTTLPLNQFKPGQPLMVKFSIGNDHYAFSPAEFVAIEKGNVKVKILDGWEPDWYSSYELELKYPNRIAMLRAKSCLVWGKGPGDGWERCHWFKDTKTPAS